MPFTVPRPGAPMAWQRSRAELRELAETAATAAGGGTTLTLAADPSRPGQWRATVLSVGGGQVGVELDAMLGTAEVSAGAQAAVRSVSSGVADFRLSPSTQPQPVLLPQLEHV